MRIRIPSWASGATVSVNGVAQGIATTPGTYATLTRSWTSGDTVTVRLPMSVIARAANDNASVVALTYGPVVLSGNYGNTTLSALPALRFTPPRASRYGSLRKEPRAECVSTLESVHHVIDRFAALGLAPAPPARAHDHLLHVMEQMVAGQPVFEPPRRRPAAVTAPASRA